MRVLVVEVDQKVAAFIRRGLEEEGYAVDVAADLEMDPAHRVVTRARRRLDLRPKEYALLEFLMLRALRQRARLLR